MTGFLPPTHFFSISEGNDGLAVVLIGRVMHPRKCDKETRDKTGKNKIKKSVRGETGFLISFIYPSPQIGCDNFGGSFRYPPAQSY